MYQRQLQDIPEFIALLEGHTLVSNEYAYPFVKIDKVSCTTDLKYYTPGSEHDVDQYLRERTFIQEVWKKNGDIFHNFFVKNWTGSLDQYTIYVRPLIARAHTRTHQYKLNPEMDCLYVL